MTQNIREKPNILNGQSWLCGKVTEEGSTKKQKFLTSHDTKLAKAQCLGVEQLSGFLLSTLDSCLIIGEDEVFSECVVLRYSFICVRIDCDIFFFFSLLEYVVCVFIL